MSTVLLTDKESRFLHHLSQGLTPAAAAAAAGYANPSATSRALLSRPHIRDEVARLQAKMAETASMSRERVLGMLKQAYDLAVDQENPTAIVRVASEISKLCGLYEQGERQSRSIEGLAQAMEQADDPFTNLSEQELLRLASPE